MAVMKKAEMEEHRAKYHDLLDRARSAERNGDHRGALQAALSSLDYVDGMMQYDRKYADKEFTSVQSIDVILKYAPLVFDFRGLDTLDALLKDCRRIERDTSDNLGERLAAARARMWDAHRLWNHLEQNVQSRQDELAGVLGGDQNQWRSIAEVWTRMGVIRRKSVAGSYLLSLSTRLGEVVAGKCPSCGSVAALTKATLLQSITCPKCRADGLWVILAEEEKSGGTSDA